MTDEELMALCAIRYTLPRMSYITADGHRWAREHGRKSVALRTVLISDMREASLRLHGLGWGTDRLAWLGVLAELEAMPERERGDG
jgi:hypothetical protein